MQSLTPVAATYRPVPEMAAQNNHSSVYSAKSCASYAWNRWVLNPPQVVNNAWKPLVAWLGRIGWVTKGLMYLGLGGLLCRSAVSDSLESQSPQAVFLLVGSFPVHEVALALLGIAILVYVVWRFVEGFLGQGYRIDAGPLSNFFRYRLSPLVSGGVYLGYAVYVFKLLDYAADLNDEDREEDWEEDQDQLIPGIGLSFLLAVAFLAAFISQLLQAARRHSQFVNEMDANFMDRHPRWTRLVEVLGRVGFFGRAVVFLLVSVLFWKVVAGTITDEDRYSSGSIMSRALGALHEVDVGRAFLFITGFAVMIYGLFAIASTKVRKFPTLTVEAQRMQAMPVQPAGFPMNAIAAGAAGPGGMVAAPLPITSADSASPPLSALHTEPIATSQPPVIHAFPINPTSVVDGATAPSIVQPSQLRISTPPDRHADDGDVRRDPIV